MTTDPGAPAVGSDPDEPDVYVVQHVRDALAADPRVGELDLHVSFRGRRVFVTGEVHTEARRSAVGEIVADLLPGREVANETTASPLDEPSEQESLS